MNHMYTRLEKLMRRLDNANEEIQTLLFKTSFVGATLLTQFLIERSPPQRPQRFNTVVATPGE